MKRLLLAFPLMVLVTAARSNEDELMKRAQAMFKPVPESPPVLEDTPMTPEAIELGKMLYFEPRLSSSWLISCNTCHNLSLGGVDLLETSVGHGWQKGPRNAPTVLNSVFNVAQFWDGRAKDLMEQAMGPVQAAVEMNSTPERAVATLKSIPEYVQRFEAVFPGDPEPVSFENMARAIEAFEATLLTPDSRFDQYLKGNSNALGAMEKKGLALFMDKGCAACHGGVNVGGGGYFPFGVLSKPDAEVLPPDDKGRFTVTNTAADEYVFKSPSLRNIAITAPYFHSGAVWELDQAVGIMGSVQLGQELSDDEARTIVAFLQTLTGEQPVVEYPTLPTHTAETPLPDLSVEAAETSH
ncbi:MAG: cytochrome C peroxidase [Gemmatimonas sp. SG8_38_2]|nr:MAG: cytochrome C peroxidase [Gemmatimonas sp. SG8_38_2]